MHSGLSFISIVWFGILVVFKLCTLLFLQDVLFSMLFSFQGVVVCKLMQFVCFWSFYYLYCVDPFPHLLFVIIVAFKCHCILRYRLSFIKPIRLLSFSMLFRVLYIYKVFVYLFEVVIYEVMELLCSCCLHR